MSNLVNISNDMGWYKWYKGKAINGELPDRLEAMQKESNQINSIIKNSAKYITINDNLLKEFKEYILILIQKENSLLNHLNIKTINLSDTTDITEIEKIEKEKGKKLTNKLKNATINGSAKARLIDYLTSKTFLDTIAKRGAIMSFTVLGGSDSFEKNNSKQRSAGKTNVEKILKKVFDKNNKQGAEELLNFLIGQDDINKTQAEQECIDLLIQAIDEEINNSFSYLMVQRGTRLTTSEKKIKTWFKQLGKKLSQKAQNQLGKNNKLISQSMQNLIDGNLVPINATFALQLNDYINDTKGMYQDYIHSVFYTKEDTKKMNISTAALAKQLYQLIVDSLNNDNNLKTWLQERENKVEIMKMFKAAWSNQNLSTDFDVYNKSNISNVCGIVATTLLFSNISNDLKIKLNDARNQLSQLSASDMSLSLFDKSYGIQIKNYTSSGKTVTLYDDTSFNIMSDTAQRYISEELLRCVRFLLINSSILSKEMNIEVDREAIKKVLLLELAPFLRIDDYKAEDTFNKNSFFVINGQVLSSAYILCQAYKQAEQMIKQGKIYNLFDIMGKTTTDQVNDNAEIDRAAPVQYDPYMPQQRGKSIQIGNVWYPKKIQENNLNLASNIILSFKGIKVKL